jgi:HSP20 family molecular chaperone IbpA
MHEGTEHAANGGSVKYVAMPKVDVFENADEFLVVADLPGVAKDDLQISWAKGELTLEGRNGDRLYRRAFTVPDGVDSSGIEADLANGVLTLKLPKAAEVKPRKIQVRSS